ncbi:MAG: translesion error-prone DNA polymerase V autoproteolytic subunit [Pseudomonas sp.]|nr:MAG: translesion error-prone DNA polymerase V autoproteolytic subunit [Pseudomonas sp.]
MSNRDLVNLAELHTLVPVIWPLKPTGSSFIPAFPVKCPAGYPSPAADFCETPLDLHAYLVKHRAATFIFDVCGDSMKNAGIFDGDKIVVDRAVEAKSGDIIVAILNGEHTVKRVHITSDGIELRPENHLYQTILLGEAEELIVFGVVVGVVRKLT